MSSKVKTGAEQINDEVIAVIDRHLQARLERAEADARRAEEAFAAERDLMLAFQRDGTLPEHVARRVSIRTDDAPTGPDVEAALLCTGHIVEIAARDQGEVTTRNGVEIDNSLVIAITP